MVLHKDAVATGNDGAVFTIHCNHYRRPLMRCYSCGQTVHLAIRYRDGAGGITVWLHSKGFKEGARSTILGDAKNTLGVNCGCYGKFHRQVAHIQDSMKARKS